MLTLAKKHVFISHSHVDNAMGERVCAAFEKQGIRCWYSSRSSDLEPGVEWDDNIVRALDQSFAVVVVFSKSANASRWVKRELAMAGDRDLTIFPLRIQNLKPTGGMEAHLVSVQWTDAFAGPIEGYLEPISKRLKPFFPEIAPAAKPIEPPKPFEPPKPPPSPAVKGTSVLVSRPPQVLQQAPPKSVVVDKLPTKSVLERLEAEMAGLLGRPVESFDQTPARKPIFERKPSGTPPLKPRPASQPESVSKPATPPAKPNVAPVAPLPEPSGSAAKITPAETSRKADATANPPVDAPARPRLAPGRTVSDEGLKGFRDVIAEAESLGEATRRGAKTAREAFAATPPRPAPEAAKNEALNRPDFSSAPESKSQSQRDAALAELARLIGQSDPFTDGARRAGARNPSNPDAGPASEWLARPAETDEPEAYAPKWSTKGPYGATTEHEDESSDYESDGRYSVTRPTGDYEQDDYPSPPAEKVVEEPRGFAKFKGWMKDNRGPIIMLTFLLLVGLIVWRTSQ